MARKIQVRRRLPQRRQPRRVNPANRAIIERNSVLLIAPNVTVTNTVYPFASQVIKINADDLASTGAARLASFLQLYDEFKFTRLSLRWEAALPSTSTGQVAMYYDPDPNAEIPTSFEQVSGNKFLRVGHVARSQRLQVPDSVQRQARFNWFTRKKTDEQGTQGAVVVAFSPGTVPHAAGKVGLGSLWLDYTVMVRAPTSTKTTAPKALIEWPVQPLIDYEIYDSARHIGSTVGVAAGQNVIRTYDSRPRMEPLSTIDEEDARLIEAVQALRNEVASMADYFARLKVEIEGEERDASIYISDA